MSRNISGRLTHFGDLHIIREGSDRSEAVNENLKFDLCSFQVVDMSTKSVSIDYTNAIKRIEINFNRGKVTFGNPPESVSMASSFPVLIDWKSFWEPDLDLKNLKSCQDRINEWMVQIGIPEGSNYYVKVNDSCIPLLVSTFGPGVFIEDQLAEVILMFVFFVLGNLL